jgi:hypothetical protein
MNRVGGCRGRAALWGTLLATAGFIASAGNVLAQQQPSPPPVIGPDALRDFNLQPQRRIVTQPRPTAPVPTPAPTPPAAQPSAPSTAPTGETRPAVRHPTLSAPPPAPRTNSARLPIEQPIAPAPGLAVPPPAGQAVPQPAPVTPQPAAEPSHAPEPAPGAAAAGTAESLPWWTYVAGGLLVALAAFVWWRRRQASQLRTFALAEETEDMPVPQPSPPRVPRPDPVPRPWIELDLVAERATADAKESVVEFALTIRNSGGSTAHNVRLQAKLICGTLAQDEEIAAFQRLKPGEHRTIPVPDLPAGEEISIKGRVDIKGEELKALRVEQRLLFIPLVAVNAFYEWSGARTGQTSKSFLVGREKPDPAERMAPFRLDLGPRVYRTVGQRPYKIQKRV